MPLINLVSVKKQQAITRLQSELADLNNDQYRLRGIVEKMALAGNNPTSKSELSLPVVRNGTSIAVGFLVLALAGCEKVPVLEARVQGDQLITLTEYQQPDKPSQYWAFEDDWHSVFMSARALPDRLLFFARTHDDPSQTPPSVWWVAGARPMIWEVQTECAFEVQYFDNPASSFSKNFLKYNNPEIYPPIPEASAPGVAAILTVQDCVGPDIDVSITVLDASNEPAREHHLTIHLVQVDWYYNPLFP